MNDLASTDDRSESLFGVSDRRSFSDYPDAKVARSPKKPSA